jgi:TRAP-type C4-dicarboxylate transport system substrate-binding protein
MKTFVAHFQRSIVPVIALAFTTPAAGGPPPSELNQPAFTLRVATVAPRGSTFHKSFEALGEKWRTAPGGGVVLDIFPGTQGGEATIVRRMNPRVAQLDGAMLTAGGIAQIERTATALQYMPMMFRSWAEVDFARERLRPRLEGMLLEKGYVVLFWGDAGWVRWFSKKPIVHPADLKPMNVYAAAGDADVIELMKHYCNPILLESDKIINGLQTDMISTVSIPPFLANFLQISTYTGYMLDLEYAPVTGAMVMTRRAWDKLPADTQIYLRTTAEEAGAEIRRNSRAEDAAAIVAMREKHGLKVTSLSPDVAEEWRTFISEIYPQLRGTIVPAEVFDETVAALNEYRSAHQPRS